MHPSKRYGLVGIAALALLTLVQWLREQRPQLEPVGTYLLGVTPNFAAAIAISFVLLSVQADQKRTDSTWPAGNRFLVCAAISGLGLIGWEFVQTTSKRLVFDIHDVLATLVGIATAPLLFYAISPRSADGDAAGGR